MQRLIRQKRPGLIESRLFCASRLFYVALLLGMAGARPAAAQLVVKLKPETVAEFDRYVQSVESQLQERWQGKKPFLSLEDDAGEKQKVLAGDLYIKELPRGNTVAVTDGLIHDWVGAVFIPHASLAKVLAVLRDFDEHKKIYPEITDSRTVRRDGDDITGYWRLERKGLAPVKLDVEQQAHYQQLSPTRWICKAYARKINEIDMGLFTRGRRYPVGEGHGYMWRLYAYWSLESADQGVLAECRTLSLSRDIPQGVAWAVGPYVQKLPQESLTSTLEGTRKAVGAEK